MAVNRFDRPIDSQFINTYSPIPFEQMMQAGAMKQQRYDQTAGAMDASIARAEEIGAMPDSVDARNRDAALDTLYTIRDKYSTMDLSNSMVVRQLNNEIRSAASPSDIRKWEESRAGWESYQKQKALMHSKGQQVYDDYDFKDYDSSVSGVFSGMPMMDLGQQAELEIDRFLKTAQHDTREIPLPSGRMALERYTDSGILETLIDNDAGSLLKSPAIQQLMEKGGMDETAFRQSLKKRIPNYMTSDITSASWRPGTGQDNTTLDPYGGVYRTVGEGGIENWSAREVKAGLEQDVATLIAGEELLKNMEKEGSGYTEEEIKRVRNSNEKQSNLNTAKKIKIDGALSQVESEFVEPRESIYDKYMGLLVVEENLSKKQARRILDRGLIIPEEQKERTRLEREEGISRGEEMVDVTLNRVARNTGNTLFDAGESIVDILKGMGRKMGGGTLGLIESFNDEMQGLRLNQKKAEKLALSEAFSQTNTADVMLVSQRKKSNGYVEVEDLAGDFHQSHIYNQVSSQITSHPEEFVAKSSNSNINDDMNEYLKKAHNSEEWSLDLRGASSVVDKDGAVTLLYDLNGPKDKESGSIEVTISDPFQIENIAKDFVTQGDPIAAARMSYGWLMPQAISNEGATHASYDIYKQNLDLNTIKSKPIITDKVEVHFDAQKGTYSITIKGKEVAKDIKDIDQVGNRLIEIQMMALGQDPRKG